MSIFSFTTNGWSACEGDTDCDGAADGVDLANLANTFGTTGCGTCDDVITRITELQNATCKLYEQLSITLYPVICFNCGNGILEPLEFCDDGNIISGDGCDSNCDAECPADTSICGESCIDLSSDPDNCGKCGNVCGNGENCISGSCVAVCVDAI